MASYSVAAAKHATLVASTVDTVTLTTDVTSVEVKNRGTSDIYLTKDGTVPTVGGDDTIFLGPGEAVVVPTPDTDVIKLISASTPAYSVMPGYTRRASGGGVAGSTVTVTTATAATATKSNVSGSASSVTVLAANTSRKKYCVYNDSTAVLYLDLSGGTASATSFTVLVPGGGFYENSLPVGTGLITGIWATATGAARVTEWV